MRKIGVVLSSLAVGLLGACSDDLEAGGEDVDAGIEDDPLVFEDPAPAESLEALQRDIIQERCSGEPGLCHNGQFEPNLSTTANSYAWMVQRPAIENFGKLRVEAGNPAASFLIDKIRNINGVGTQMPLGAEPLTEEEIKRFEDWIEAGALRAPDADAPTLLNNPPKVPELAAFNGANRIDNIGTYQVPINTTITFRHTVEDFETADDGIFLGGIIFTTAMGNISFGGEQDLGVTTFDDTNPPMGTSDLLNYELDMTFGANVDVVVPGQGTNPVSTTGLVITPIALYIDLEPGVGGIIAVRLPDASFTVQ